MKKLLWIDLETTGLDVNYCLILEVGMIVTDTNLNILDSFSAVIHRTQYDMNHMNDWCRKTHAESGLLTEVRLSGLSQGEVEQQAMQFITKHFGDEKPVAFGSSVHFDKKFIEKHMPSLNRKFHYRIVDVSSFKETLKILFNYEVPMSSAKHRALDDIKGSINEYSKYLDLINVHRPSKEFHL